LRAERVGRIGEGVEVLGAGEQRCDADGETARDQRRQRPLEPRRGEPGNCTDGGAHDREQDGAAGDVRGVHRDPAPDRDSR
jgi:hypothetical protein